MSESAPTPKVIKPISAADYRKAPKEQLVTLASGAVFLCKRPSPEAVLTYMIINESMPKQKPGEPVDNRIFYKFMKDNYKIILDEIVLPSIIEPKIPAEDLLIEDVMELSIKLLEMAGMNEEERATRQRFREQSSV
jgi:hypothetical protein